MANVGDLFVNFKVNTDGLNAGSGALSSFVSKSKRDIGAMNGGVDALSQSLSKLGLDPSFVIQFRDFVQLGTKQLPKMVEGLTALARQAATLSASKVATSLPSASDFIGPMPFIGPMSAAKAPEIELAPLEAARAAIIDTRSEMQRLVDAGKTRFPQGGVISYGDEIERAMRRARESAASGSAAVADAIELGAAGVASSTKTIETSVASAGVATTQAFTKSASSATTFGSAISGAASRAVSAARAIGTAIYSTIGPIGLAVAAIVGIGVAFYNVISGQAAAAEEAFQRTLTMVKERAEAASKAVADMVQTLARSRDAIDAMNAKMNVQQAVLAAPVGQEEAAAKQADRLNQQLAASNAIIAAEQKRDEIQKSLAIATEQLQREQEGYDKFRGDSDTEALARTRQIIAEREKEVAELQDAAAKARLNVDATSDQLLLLQQSFELEDKIAAKKAEQEAAEQRRLDRASAMNAFMSEELSLEDERIRLLEGEEALQTALYQRRLEAAGLEEEMISYLMAQRAEVEALSKTREEADRKEQERKSTLEAIAGDLSQREAELTRTSLELTIGKAAAEAQLLETKMRSLGVSEDEIRATMERLSVIQDQEKAIKDAQKAEEERQKMVERAAQMEKDIAAATESARAKAMDEELKRQQLTETLSTAIGGITVAGASDAIDIDKRVYDETKKQTDELKKINEALRSSGVAVLT